MSSDYTIGQTDQHFPTRPNSEEMPVSSLTTLWLMEDDYLKMIDVKMVLKELAMTQDFLLYFLSLTFFFAVVVVVVARLIKWNCMLLAICIFIKA